MIYLLRKDAFIPSADTVKNYIMTFYEDNAWTSSNNYSFLEITAHWVTESWELKSILLDFIKLKGPHSGANIKEAFLKRLKNFEIESKINNTSNNVTFLKAVEDDLSQKYIYFNSDDKHVRCLAHVINLAAQQALTTFKAVENDEISDEEVGSLICKLRTLVKKLKASPQQENKFKAQCKAANVPNLNVMLDSLNTLSNSDPTLRPFTINEEEWVHLLEIEELLKVSELYKIIYASQKTQNTNIEYNSSDEDFVSHISKRHCIESRHEEEYPNLSNMARDYLGIPVATSAPSERIFLSAANVIIYDRASLAPKTVCAVMCLKH
ncbi:zinc finger BED domain-containing protein RICESLEEPER 2-like [Rhizophagus clarus]|uniref:Zinc finger BED domain-containing protein RICESLEEPER 2-like n=1 Tax=Rhizophagus clarus TaxID=94130 RepID=A0A8H3QTF1_9GLOM|nr:zinc finger BED domain-containing protein RICESLEEPER 2-like [Rhizophagus clarus]